MVIYEMLLINQHLLKKEVLILSNQTQTIDDIQNNLRANCEKCFSLCCVALPYAKSADFALDKNAGTPCTHLQANFRCSIHTKLRNNGYKGCTVYECFGAGQKVSQMTFKGKDWRSHPDTSNEMFTVFPIMQQLHEMLLYLHEALHREETKSIYHELKMAFDKTEALTFLDSELILAVDLPIHRNMVNKLLLQSSELVRARFTYVNKQKLINRSSDLVGSKLKGANLKGSNLRGALLIAADLREADMVMSDLIGADLRDANLKGANLRGSIFLTQAQINSANGDLTTKLPAGLTTPQHWLK